MEGSRYGLAQRTCRSEELAPGVSQGTSSGLESGWPRVFQSCGKPQGPGGAVRLSRHLHLASLGPRPGAAPAAFAGAHRVLGRQEPGTAALFADARAARGGAIRLAARDGGLGRYLSPAALAAGRCLSVPHRRTQARSGRHHRARTGHMAGRSSRPPAGQGQRGCTSPFVAGKGRAAGLQHGGHPRWRAPQCRRDQGAAVRGQRPATDPGTLGRGGRQEARAHAGAIPGHRTGGGGKRSAVCARRCVW